MKNSMIYTVLYATTIDSYLKTPVDCGAVHRKKGEIDMLNNVSKEFSKEIVRLMTLLDKYGWLFYNFDEGCFSIYNQYVNIDEDLDYVIAYLREHYKTRKSIYKVSYLDDYDGGIAVGYKNVKELVKAIKENEFSREAWNKQKRRFDLLKEQETLGVMKWANSSEANIRRQEEWIEHLEEELKNFDKNLELTLKECTTIEKISK